MIFKESISKFLLYFFTILGSIAVFVGLFNSVLASVFNLPVFVTTIAMLSFLNALVLLLININGTGSEIAIPAPAVVPYNTVEFKMTLLIGFFLLCVFIFSFTKIGRKQKFQGGNPYMVLIPSDIVDVENVVDE